jgi:hypothetical protein
MKRALLLLAAMVWAASAHAQTLPDAPAPNAAIRAYTPTLPTNQPDAYFRNRVNLQLFAAQLAAHTLDTISTRQRLTDPCRCYIESGNRFTDSQFVKFGHWTGAANSFAIQELYGLMVMGGSIAESRLLWSLAQHRKPGKLRKALEWAAREPLVFDLQNNLRMGYFHNEAIAK